METNKGKKSRGDKQKETAENDRMAVEVEVGRLRNRLSFQPP
jgi:hypothetical protein